MAHAQLNGVVRHLRSLRNTEALAEASDTQLLQHFTATREESAFTLLLRRHGPMVLSVARRVLGNAQDAEDVFQAAFLLLARKAGSIRKRESVASWLYGVTRRLALKARTQGMRRQMRERRAADLRDQQTSIDSAWQDVPTILDTALGELPECYRAALVLCYLEGKTHAEAARQLGCPLATLRTRVVRGRNLLRDRLARHGLTLSAAGLFTLLVASAAPAAAPAELVRAAVKAALPMAAGQPAATLCPARVADLVEGGLSMMFLSKTKVATLVLLAAGLLAGTGALVRMQPAVAESGAPPAAEKTKPATPAAGPDTKDQDKEAISFAGRVLDPDGKPFAAAKLYLLYEYDAPTAQPVPVRATSDAEGHFRFRIKRADFGRSLPWVKAPPWENATVVAVARGHGLGMPEERGGKPFPRTGLTLRLAKDDTPLRGRILDLQGKPIAGVTVRVQGLRVSAKNDLAAFVKAVKETKEIYPPMFEHLSGFEGFWRGQGVGTLFEPVTTGVDGRFQIKGIGPERLVGLRIEGPTIATRDVYAMTRPGDTIQAPGYRQYPPEPPHYAPAFVTYGNVG
jgi:RNA polymerase sigma factor (sigma-70 family)